MVCSSCVLYHVLMCCVIIVAIHVGLTAMEYFTIEDNGVMSVVLESDQPANTSITVTLQLTSNSASGISLHFQLLVIIIF